MDDASLRALTGTIAFRLGVLGALAEARFAGRIERHGLRPKHVGLLTAIGAGAAASQQELAGAMRVVPSVVVANADELERLGAVRRVRDRGDRRRQNLVLTPRGRELLAECSAAARAVDDEIAADLDEGQRDVLRRLLGVVAATEGLPVEEPGTRGAS